MRPRLIRMQTVPPRAARKPRAYVRVRGPDAEEFLQRMVSNDVTQGDEVDALLLTPKARLIAPLRVLRRGSDDFLLLTEPELGETVGTSLLGARLPSKGRAARGRRAPHAARVSRRSARSSQSNTRRRSCGATRKASQPRASNSTS